MDGKFKPRSAYPKTMPYFMEDAENQVELFADANGAEHAPGFRKALKMLKYLHQVRPDIFPIPDIFGMWEKCLARWCTVLVESVDELCRLTGKDNPRKADIRFVALAEIGGNTRFRFPDTMDLQAPKGFFVRTILAELEWEKETSIWEMVHTAMAKRLVKVPSRASGSLEDGAEANREGWRAGAGEKYPAGSPVGKDLEQLTMSSGVCGQV